MRRLFPILLFCTAAALAADPIVSEFGQGISAYNSREYAAAARHLRAARQLPELSDYVTYYLGSSLQQLNDYPGALAVLDAWRKHPVAASPLTGRISVLHARVLLDMKDPAATARAIALLTADYEHLQQPDGDFALGLAYEARNDAARNDGAHNDLAEAARFYQRVYYGAPAHDLAASASASLDRLRAALGDSFPKPSARQQLDRAGKWLTARQYLIARQEYAALAESLTGPDRDEASLGIGIALYDSGDFSAAARSLGSVRLTTPDTEAARLFYLAECARRTTDDPALLDIVHQLGERFPQSPWRLKALVAAGGRFVAAGNRDRYEEMYRAASENFPNDPATAPAHWKLAWDAWLDDKPDRLFLLREQIERFPDDGRASSALYYLGRAAENEDKFAAARAYFDRLNTQFPHYFYTILGRQRSRLEQIAKAQPDPAVKSWLATIRWPEHRDLTASEPNPATKARIERTRLLIEADQTDLAEAEARFGARAEGEQSHILAMELARLEPTAFRALHVMKSLNADYLSIPTASAPASFWQLLYPLPYKDDLFRNAASRDLDPFSVAGLIRQESEFNPGAKSKANAYGLMQLLPVTGREMARKQGIAVGTASLLNPVTNIRLGTEYLRTQLSRWMGDWYQTLAAYNAGPTHVREWVTSGMFREPAEFVESIPFNETREYVQAVLRNADMYREIYSAKPAALTQRVTQPVSPAAAQPVTKTAAQPLAKAAVHPAAKPAVQPAAKKAVIAAKAPPKAPAAPVLKAAVKTPPRPAPKKTVTAHRAAPAAHDPA